MSKSADIYDLLRALVPALITDIKELKNARIPEDDADITYQKAYGIIAGAAANQNLNPTSGFIDVDQTFDIVLTRRVFSTPRDITNRVDVEKGLLDDAQLIIDQVNTDPFFGNTGTVQNSFYVGHDGIQQIRTNRQDILSLTLTFTISFQDVVPLCR